MITGRPASSGQITVEIHEPGPVRYRKREVALSRAVQENVVRIQLFVANNDQRIMPHIRSDRIRGNVLNGVRNPKVIEVRLDETLKIHVIGAAGIHQHQRIRSRYP